MSRKLFILDYSPKQAADLLDRYAASPLMDLEDRKDRLRFRLLHLKAEGKHREAREFYNKHKKNML